MNTPLAPSTPTMRRSATMPLRQPQKESHSQPSSPHPQIETLYAHPSARVVSFNAATPNNSLRHSKGDAATPEDEAGALLWTSKTERTMAVGPLRIYRTPNSVTFLNCGDVVRPIFPKSKCWCVEEASGKFVLEMGKPQYWRLEVPNKNAEDIERMEQLKDVLGQVLLFEKTVCPFERNFTVELPEAPSTPIKYRPWTPREKPTSVPEFAADSSPSTSSTAETICEEETASSDDELINPGPESENDASEQIDVSPRNLFPRPAQTTNPMPDVLQTSRSVTAPPQLTLLTSPPSKGSRTKISLERTFSYESSTSELSSSAESFHSVESWHSGITPLPPSPPASKPASPAMFPYPHDEIKLPKRPAHARDLSEITIIPQSPKVWTSVLQDPLRTPTNFDGLASPKATTVALPVTPTTQISNNSLNSDLNPDHFALAPRPPTNQVIRHRATTTSNSRRALSPLPPAVNIFSPPSSRRRPRHLQTTKHLPTAILQKTYEILLSPPSHLVSLMLEWASRIVAGGWWSHEPESWDMGEYGSAADWGWQETEGDADAQVEGNSGGSRRGRSGARDTDVDVDDYGISVETLKKNEKDKKLAKARRRKEVGKSWGVD